MDISDHLEKVRYSKDGKPITEKAPRTVDAVKQAIADKEFCRIKGYIEVKKVPGNWHISFHAYRDLLYGLNHDQLSSLKFGHTINHLSFGSAGTLENISANFGSGEQT
jgi:hypothetical protein